MSITLVLGGARAGKSRYALTEAERRGGRMLFVATAEARDEEMRTRINAHRAERGGGWETIEAPSELREELERHLAAQTVEYDTIVVDCLTLWTSNLMERVEPEAFEETIRRETSALVEFTKRHRDACWIFISNEVGLGIVPENAVARAYRDALGRVNQIVAAAADNVVLLVAGIPMQIK